MYIFIFFLLTHYNQLSKKSYDMFKKRIEKKNLKK